MPRPDGPSAAAWVVALVSAALPWCGAACLLAGAWLIAHGGEHGVALIIGGIACLAVDVTLDWVWAHPATSRSDEPALNRRGSEWIGRVVVLAEPIEGGRGKARCGDTLWLVQGPDLPADAHVRVIGVTGMLLLVEPV